jgi:hypothetical protein
MRALGILWGFQVRRVCSLVGSGGDLSKLTPSFLETGKGWGLRPAQAANLSGAIKALNNMCFGDDDSGSSGGGGGGGPCVEVDVSFYWPKILEPGRRTARASR